MQNTNKNFNQKKQATNISSSDTVPSHQTSQPMLDSKKPNIKLPKALLNALEQSLDNLAAFKEELTTKSAIILEQADTIHHTIQQVESKEVQINPKLSNIFKKTAENYAAMIAQAQKEITFYLTFYQQYLDGTAKHLSKLKEQNPLLLEVHVAGQLKFLKQYLKKRKKDFAVFFSRYDHGYTTHMQKLKTIKQFT